ncbi:NADPH:quinone reductase-like Zn-dependent oxidoreductase [Stella humosa]|uniref:NADPH:quinone reductase-like Zn-dependent oxidoreductase n=1 Tax=Stella humosa TaxID=94 RepID=A0A3N1L1B8_9PROT|nr:zinc-dependent alcohol dehydrogenase family protein [Stella humosa]ROP83305.1 NADPH:quinone reductase-like Zn-dependent oxidoreductase [Stella humosa]BBK29912.1 alcohol dehydrogenase [Stella humosa]
MKRVVFHAFGEPGQVLAVEDVPDPVPGAGEVLVRMRLCPINPADLLTVRGLYGTRPRLPAVPGYEGLGIVAALGQGVTAPAIGTRVVPMASNGTWQELCVAKAAALLPLPDAIGDESAAQFVVNPLTALAMVEELATRPGDWLVQTAAGSTLGRIVLQLARTSGFHTVNLVRRPEQAAELAGLGADLALTPDDGELGRRVVAATGGATLLRATDAAGGSMAAAALGLLAPGGTLLSYGMMSGEPIPVDPAHLVFRDITVRGFWLTNWMRRAGGERRAALIARLAGLMGQGLVVPPVAAILPLDRIAEAVAAAERPGRAGKVLLSA